MAIVLEDMSECHATKSSLSVMFPPVGLNILKRPGVGASNSLGEISESMEGVGETVLQEVAAWAESSPFRSRYLLPRTRIVGHQGKLFELVVMF